LTQAAVSARIKLFESQLGVPLFVRRYKDLQLTPEELRLVRHADRLLSSWRKVHQVVLLLGGSQQ
jgi:DNA-binding transcriptional LysR family regulator